MRTTLVKSILIFSSMFCSAVAVAQTASCPSPSQKIQASCREISYKDLPHGARLLLRKLQCDVQPGGPYDWASAVDLNNDGSPEYEVCCHEAPHGPCGAVLIGKVGTEWKDLTAKDGMLGFDGACTLMVVLESQHKEFHDLCLPTECSQPVSGGKCAPAIWRYDGSRYRASDDIPAKPSQQEHK